MGFMEFLSGLGSGAQLRKLQKVADQVNSILMAGRADLVLLARPHLSDPYWTLHAAVEMGDTAQHWPAPYEGGRRQALQLAERAKAMAR